MQIALRRHQAGRLTEAEALYRQILSCEPNHPGALHLLGVLASQAGRPDTAVELLRRAAAIRPLVPEYQSNLGDALRLLGRFEEAAAACRRAIELKPDFAEAHNNLGNVLLDQGLLDAAIAAYRRAVQIDPASTRLNYHLGNALSHRGQFDAAIAAYREAVCLDPDCAEAWNGLGHALRERGEFGDAIAVCRRATELRPGFAEAWNNLANALAEGGQLDDAICAGQRAIQIRPNFAEARSNLGISLCEKGELDEAVAAHRRALEIAPDFAKGHSNLGDALVAKGRLDDAVAAYGKAIQLQPDAPAIGSHRLYTLHYHPAYDARALFQEHRQWNECHARPLECFIRPHNNDLSPERRLRIGFVSPDFRDHVVGRQLLPLFRGLHATEVEIHAYANVARTDEVTEELRSLAHGWRNILGLPDEDAAKLIRADAVDILVDLALHTDGNRLTLFARKPAPVQVTWLGYCSTSGLVTIDYRFSDTHLDPPGVDLSPYSEETVYLPRTYWCYEPAGPTPDVTPLPALASGSVNFGCLNNFAKVSGPTLELWMEILRAAPDSRLLLHAPVGSARESVLERFERHTITPERVEFVGRQSWEQYLRTLQRIDIALDPFPYGGGISTCDALWMGVPVVTLSGETAVGRGGRSILSTIGLPELIAETRAQYAQIAVSLATDLTRLSELRSSLRDRMERSPLRDAGGFARDMEAVWRDLWRRWCRKMEARTAQEIERALQHQRARRFTEAEGIYREVLALYPEEPNALHRLGTLLDQIGQPAAAIELIGQSVALRPDVPEAHNNLGNALQAARKLDEAIAEYHRALELRPEYGLALFNMGNALTANGQVEEAIAAYREASRLMPGHRESHGNLIYSLYFHPDYDARAILAEACRWEEQHARRFEKEGRSHANDRSPERRLRLGYVSPDFREHVVGRNLLPLLREHDRNTFEVFCYSNVLRPDAFTEQCRSFADVWRDIAPLDDDQAAALIEWDQIDILVDLSLHMDRNRLRVFARRPAPVQLTYLGYCGTTGLQAMDYRLSDPFLDPPGADLGGYSEKTMRLSRSYWCYEPLGPSPDVSPPPALVAGHLTFGCLNNFAKVSPAALELWLGILQAVPASRLLLHAPAASCRERIRRSFDSCALPAERLEFVAREGWPEYIRTLQRVDVALDPFPYGGGITTCDALWMGVPVVSLSGKTAVGRGGRSILSNIGLPELIADTPLQYLEIARELANDLPRLSQLRKTLRQRLDQSPLRDAPAHARQIEAAYREMWIAWCKSGN